MSKYVFKETFINKQMKVIIYGSKGWIGSLLLSQLQIFNVEVIESTTRIHPGNEDILKNEIQQVDSVICSVGRVNGVGPKGIFINNIDYLETIIDDEEQPRKPFIQNIQDNLYAPILLATLCTQLNKHMLYVGTSCIFNQNTTENQEAIFDDQSYPNFFGSSYSIVRGYTDDLLREFSNVCICRIRLPIVNYHHSKNLITKIVSYKKINDMPNSVSYMPEIIPIMTHMCLNKATGIFNMTNPGFIKHSDILEMYKKYLNPTHSYTIVDEKDLQLLSKRCNNILKTDHLEEWCKTHNLYISNIKDCLEKCFSSWSNNDLQYH